MGATAFLTESAVGAPEAAGCVCDRPNSLIMCAGGEACQGASAL
jgi:hypothetical protein